MDEFIQELRHSAEQGDVEAQFKLGFMYAKGLALPRDEQEAEVWLGKAAEQGDVGARFQLQLLREGN
ncbi:MAG: hypothetical protein H7837_11475 [Magnetococcus sp. MYC-9]